MRNRLFLIFPMLCSMMFCTPAYALDSDLSYDFITENEEEFVIVGESNINISGQIPDYLYDIYDISLSLCMILSTAQMWLLQGNLY